MKVKKNDFGFSFRITMELTFCIFQWKIWVAIMESYVVGTIIILNYIHPEDPFVKSDFNKCTQTQKNKNYM